MNHSSDAFRKAAILIDALDPQAADALMDQIAPEHAAQIRQAVMDLDTVAVAERDRVLESFVQKDRRPATSGGAMESDATRIEDGIELDVSLAARLAASPVERQSEPAADTAPFQYLHDAEVASLASFLIREHPQTIAVVLSHVTPDRAAEVLEELEPALQFEVVFRVTHLNEMDPEIISEIEQELESRLSEQIQTSRRRSAGISAVRAMLQQASAATREQIVTQLADRDQQLAAQVGAEAQATNLVSGKDPVTAAAVAVSDHEQTERSSGGRFHASDVREQRLAGEECAKRPAPTTAAESVEYDHPRCGAPDAGPPDRLRDSMEFDELARFDDGFLARLLAQVDPKITLLALRGAKTEFVDRILSKLPAREAKSLRKRIQRHGPMQLRDVDRAQQHIALTASRLITDGTIRRG